MALPSQFITSEFPKAAISSQHSTFRNFDRILPFLNKLPAQETNLLPVQMSGERPSTKTCHCKSWLLFVAKNAKFSTNQISAYFSRLFRCRCLFCLFEYKVAFASFALSLTSNRIHCSLLTLVYVSDF